MARLVNYSCKSCGAALSVESGHRLFECPFCGADFDYYSFYRKDMLEQADVYLHRLDFKEARIRFDEILEHEPQEFLALRGIVLCEGRITSPKNLTRPEKLEGCNFRNAYVAIRDVSKRARSEDVPYFQKLEELLRLAEKYLNEKKEIDHQSRESDFEFRRIVEVEETVKEKKAMVTGALLLIGKLVISPFASDDAKEEDLENGAVLVLGIIGLVCVAWVFHVFGKLGALIVLGVVLLIIGLLFYARSWEKKHKEIHQQKMKGSHEMIQKSNEKMKELSDLYNRDYEDLQKMAPGDRKMGKPKSRPEGDSAFTEEAKHLICNQCGAPLTLDRENRLYSCRSCGVAYSTVLLSDMDASKTALTLLSKKDFKEADQRFLLELLLAPDDFTALRGRILCAGRWTGIEEIPLTSGNTSSQLDPVKERIEAAISRSSEGDKAYFTKFSKLIGTIEAHIFLESEVKRITKANPGNWKGIDKAKTELAENDVLFQSLRKELEER